ncbi:HD domain containing protein [Leishmania donovani]|uniref:HD_domain_containing_protein_putative/Pfam:PF0196 6 n=1 Tax=Leishmania donovani TaxID=5661 RepID=A0A6J8FL67_LEIDO|nr:HD domain containing protein [Leishmania donovani]VDZ47641.1 HD_domain_containing_protein_putative/Pfam:PF01966 [Leishmania donovani]
MPPPLRSKAESVRREEVCQMLEPKRSMSVRDTLYGQLEFPPVIRILTDSPVVQRLRDLKQLGNSFYVYPGATHSRFEHSLGVCYLGMELYRSIVDGHREEHRDFGVPEIANLTREAAQKDMHCIGIAGLCHDLGHGPLSHLFESFVRSSARPEEVQLRRWSHEQASIMLLRKMWLENETELAELGFTESDLRYVELLINGLAPGKAWPDNVGRPKWARFTTEIIANKRSGLDVDKIDYIQRDSVACLGTPTFVSMSRLFQGARVVVGDNDETSIGYPDKLDGVIEEIFLARSHLHRIVYQHRVTKVIDLMTLDALRAAGDVFEVSNGKDGVMPLRSCVLHPDFYVHASDWIVLAILHGSNRTMAEPLGSGASAEHRREKLAEARRILQRIQSRHLYTTIGSYRHSEQTLINAGRLNSVEGSSQEVKREVMIHELLSDIEVTSLDLSVKLREWSRQHNGMASIEILQAEITQTAGDMDKKHNPVSATYFFNPRQSTHCRVEPHFSCNVTTTLFVKMGPVSSLVVVCRMPLTPQEKESLRVSFTSVADRLGKTDASSFSCTPMSQRGRAAESSQQAASAARDESAATPNPSMTAAERLTSSLSGGCPAAKRLKLDLDTKLSRREDCDVDQSSEGVLQNDATSSSLELVTPAGYGQVGEKGQDDDDGEETDILSFS